MDRNRNTMTKYMNDKKTNVAINSKQLREFNHVDNTLYDVELATAEIDHKEPIIVEFFILNCAKLRMLELFTTFCDVNKFGDLEMVTDSLYLFSAEKKLEDCIRPEMKSEWKRLQSKDCTVSFTADTVSIFFPRRCCDKHKNHDKREFGLFKEDFRCREMLCFCSKTYCSCDFTMSKHIFSKRGLNKRVLEQSGDETLEKHRPVSEENKNSTSSNGSFRASNHAVATWKPIKRGLS